MSDGLAERDTATPSETAALGLRRIWWRRFRRHRAGVVGLVVVTLIVLITVVGPLVWRQDYATADFDRISEGPSLDHPLGTDQLGRDVLIRVMIGGRVSLLVATISQVLAIIFATILGMIAGYTVRWADTLIMRIVDVLMAVPDLLLLILLIPVLSGSLTSSWAPSWLASFNDYTHDTFGLILGIFIISWIIVARLVRAQILSLREEEFIVAAVNLGLPRIRIMWRHMLPNLTTVLIVSATLGIPRGVLLESGISFLGLGVSPPLPSWGTMISDGLPLMRSAPHVLIAPAIMLSLTVLSLNIVGDALRDAVDPRSSL